MFPYQKAVAKWNSSPGIHGPKLNLKGLRNLGPEQDQRKVWHLEPDRTRTKTFFKFYDQLGSIVTQILRFVNSCSLQWSLDITCSVCSDQVMVSRRRRTSLFVSCLCLVDFRISVKSGSVSVCCPDSVHIFCPDSVCLDFVRCPDSVWIFVKKLSDFCLSDWLRTKQRCPNFQWPCPSTSDG